ncbi:MAG: hypothetical protein WCJ31_07450 [Planctomycetia bacterium]
MIRILMFDVGNTLVKESDRALFPGVLGALKAIDGLKTASGGSPIRCLVSNFPATLPVPADRLNATLHDFCQLLPKELTALFEPVEKAVTLSAYVGVAKPAREFFTTAIVRLGVSADLNECVLITEQHDHVVRCKELGMSAVQFGGHMFPAPGGTDFTDWSEAPGLMAQLLTPVGAAPALANVEIAVRARLAATHPHLENVQVNPPDKPGAYPFKASAVVPLEDPALGDLNGLHVDFGVSGIARVNGTGRVTASDGAQVDAEAVTEAKHLVQGLAATGQIATRQGPIGLGETHEIVVDAQGRRRLKRIRFSAF